MHSRKTNKTWWKEAVVYQIYPRSFMDSDGDGVGDLQGITDKLDYLKDLGVDVIWLCPIYKSPNDDNGYDISDYYDIMDEFGTLSDFENMLTEMHKRGIKLMMDLVVNHTSDEHPWFVQSRNKDSEYRDFYYWREGKMNREPNDWMSFFTGPAWDYDKVSDQYYLHLFSKKQPDLNWENPKVREEVKNVIKFWLDKGVDGFRLDAINFIAKQDGLPFVGDGTGYNWGSEYFANLPKVHDYLHELNRDVLSKYDVMTVGEASGITVEDAREYSAEDREELNMVFHFEHMGLDIAEGIKWEYKPVDTGEMKEIFSRWQMGLEDRGWNSIYLGNHDQTRIVSRFGDDKNYRTESAKMLATMQLTMKGTPYIYQGDEIGMTNLASKNIADYDDVGTIGIYNELKNDGVAEDEIMDRIAHRSRDNSRTPMQWNDNENAGFTQGTPWMKINANYDCVNAENSMKDEKSIYNYYKKLIKLRKENEVFVYGRFDEIDADDGIYAYTRHLDGEKILVVLNLKGDEGELTLPIENCAENYEVLLSNYMEHKIEADKIVLKPFEAIIFTA